MRQSVRVMEGVRDMHGMQPVDQFIAELRSACPGSLGEMLLKTEYGQKFALPSGGRLVISCTSDRAVSKLHTEGGVAVPADVVDMARALANRFTAAGSRQRRLLLESLDHLAKYAIRDAVSPPAVGQSRLTEALPAAEHEAVSTGGDDPLAKILPVGTIGVRRANRSRAGVLADGRGGPGGWSQEIGRRCEQFAFEWIAARCSGTPSKDSSSIDPVRFRIGASDRLLVWINAEIEQGNSWDIEERDVATGKILRRHEVKARTGELTESEHALAVELGDAYAIWRVDPDTDMCERLRARGIQQEISPTPVRAIGSDQSHPRRVSAGTHADDPDAPTMVVLGSSTREFCRRLRRTHQCFVGRFRGNLVVAFRVTPELEKELPPSKSRVWVANRSSAGCERLLVHASMAATPSRAPASGGRLIVGIVLSGSRGLGRAMKQAGCSFMG